MLQLREREGRKKTEREEETDLFVQRKVNIRFSQPQFHESDRRVHTPGSEMKNSVLLTAIAMTKEFIFLSHFPESLFPQREPEDICAFNASHDTRGTLT